MLNKNLGNILHDIETLNYQIGDRYTILVSCEAVDFNYKLTTSTKAALVLISKEQDEDGRFLAELEENENVCELASASIAKEVVSNARQQKPNCSKEELVEALDFYLLNDAFFDLN